MQAKKKSLVMAVMRACGGKNVACLMYAHWVIQEIFVVYGGENPDRM